MKHVTESGCGEEEKLIVAAYTSTWWHHIQVCTVHNKLSYVIKITAYWKYTQNSVTISDIHSPMDSNTSRSISTSLGLAMHLQTTPHAKWDPNSTCYALQKSKGCVALRTADCIHSMHPMGPPAVATLTQVIVRTHCALVSCSVHWFRADVTPDPWVQHFLLLVIYSI